MPKRTNPFQRLSASIMATLYNLPDYVVSESVIKRSKIGTPREVDIIIVPKKNPADKVLVECRASKRKQTVQWIDELDGKSRKLGYKKVVAVSSSGFSKPAEREAKESGIETFHLREAEKLDWGNWLLKTNTLGMEVDFEAVVKKVNFITVNSHPALNGADPKDIFLVNHNTKKKISLKDYLSGFVKDPKVISHIREKNTGNAINHYDYEAPCDAGVGVVLPDGVFNPLVKVVISFDSARQSYQLPLKHIRGRNEKFLVTKNPLSKGDARIVLQEKDGQIKVMIESQVTNDPDA
jgi:hypothetical protein